MQWQRLRTYWYFVLGFVLDLATLGAISEQILWDGGRTTLLRYCSGALALIPVTKLFEMAFAAAPASRLAGVLNACVLFTSLAACLLGADSILGHAAIILTVANLVALSSPLKFSERSQPPLLFVCSCLFLVLSYQFILVNMWDHCRIANEPCASLDSVQWLSLTLCGGFCFSYYRYLEKNSAYQKTNAFISFGTFFWLLYLLLHSSMVNGTKFYLFSLDDLGLASALLIALERVFDNDRISIKWRFGRCLQLCIIFALTLSLAISIGRGILQLQTTLPSADASNQKISENFILLLLTSEDPIFMRHDGVDFLRLKDAAVEAIDTGHFGRGGSTITMQLAKVRFLPPEKTLLRKFNQIVLALLMEIKYSKEEILREYVSSVPFAENVIGLDSAAHIFFGVAPDRLLLSQALKLVLSIYDPSTYNPRSSTMPTEVKQRSIVIGTRSAQFESVLKNDLTPLAFVTGFAETPAK